VKTKPSKPTTAPAKAPAKAPSKPKAAPAKPKAGAAPRPTHYLPGDYQRHFGPPGEALCKNTGPRYFGEEIMWYGTNVIESTDCPECKRLWAVRNKMCRGCGTMLTDTSVEKYKALCTKCYHLSHKVLGIIDVDAQGKVVKTYGRLEGKEEEAQKELDEQKTLAMTSNSQYSLSQQYNPRPTASPTEEQQMAKTPETKSAKKTVSATQALKDTPKAEKKAAPAVVTDKQKEKAELLASKIKINVAENPKRGASAERFALYANGMTVEAYVAKGGTLTDVRWDAEHEFIKLS
jgi:hypothetical protein